MAAGSDRIQKLAALLRQTGRAHHQAFLDVNGEDPEWPLWYAEYLHGRIGEFFRTPPTTGQIASLLHAAQKEQAERAPGADWPEFYARFMLERHE